ncbi:hypothetical protein DPMN_008116 [Dreissena polymorpha]|uniref:Uncharacterized protein n=1 Tax=Dreissena polymorpha TaxID=45954 RepID=A0A9D4RX12_DREPO|nr:hypothetical protein DPMN_008116 [Dreissena polymorpha]
MKHHPILPIGRPSSGNTTLFFLLAGPAHETPPYFSYRQAQLVKHHPILPIGRPSCLMKHHSILPIGRPSSGNITLFFLLAGPAHETPSYSSYWQAQLMKHHPILPIGRPSS